MRIGPRFWLWLSVAVFFGLTAWVLDRYGSLPYWPGLVTGFGASLAAFVLALEWESHRERAMLERTETQTNEARSTEARKRLLALEAELKRNKTSIDTIAGTLSARLPPDTWTVLHPELLDGAWSASSERLGDLLADYDLVAHLSTFYGRLEELRWRIRHCTQARDVSLDGMTCALAVEMQREANELIDRVASEAKEPEVRLIGLVHVKGIGTATSVEEALPIRPITHQR